MSTVSTTYPLSKGWLRDAPFDMTFIFGVAFLALVSGFIVLEWPQLFNAVLLIDIWFLASPHVIATFSRIAFDKENFQKYKFLVTWLPVIIVVVTITVGLIFGAWIVATTYFYWQWFHYTRQSYGIARIYQVKTNPNAKNVDFGVIYGLPLLGILYRSYQNPTSFLGMELRCLPVPLIVIQIGFVLVILALIHWAINEYKSYRAGTFSLPLFMFMISHIVIFFVGYMLINSVTVGWLVLNIWHNTQYILFVWTYNNKQFKNTFDAKKRFLSMLSLNNNHWLFYGVCLALAFLFYEGVGTLLNVLALSSLPAITLAVYQTINFHHYIVDGIVWKARKKVATSNLTPAV